MKTKIDGQLPATAAQAPALSRANSLCDAAFGVRAVVWNAKPTILPVAIDLEGRAVPPCLQDRLIISRGEEKILLPFTRWTVRNSCCAIVEDGRVFELRRGRSNRKGVWSVREGAR